MCCGECRRDRQRLKSSAWAAACTVTALLAGLLPGAAGAADVPFGAPSPISTAADGVGCVRTADMDGDGDLDVLSASWYDDTIAWYENTDGTGGSWNTHTVATDAHNATSVAAADLDNDGDLDILATAWLDDTVTWYENADGAWIAHDIDRTADGAASAVAADLDGDGDLDVLSASMHDDQVVWYENGLLAPSEPGVCWLPRVIAGDADHAWAVLAADVDGDGDLDVLSASRDDDKIAVYLNAEGTGRVWQARTITTRADGAASVIAGDVDGDGDLDVVTASREDDVVAWYANTDGKGLSWHPCVISHKADGALEVSAADFDGDGDMDVVSASRLDDRIAWYENLDGKGGAWKTRDVAENLWEAASVVTGDVDGDGDADIISGAMHADTVAWHRNDKKRRPPKSARPKINCKIPVFNHVLFDFDKSVVKPEGKLEVAKVGAALKRHPKDTAVIEGHTCDIGTDEYNADLAQRRAESVKRCLVQDGIEAGRLTAKGIGEGRPAVPNDTPPNRKLNRRVVFDITIGK